MAGTPSPSWRPKSRPRGCQCGLSAASSPRATCFESSGRREKIMVPDNRAHETVKFAIPDLGAIAELVREDPQKCVAMYGLQWSREPEKLVELRVAEGNRRG